MAAFVRFQSATVSERGIHVGVFGLVNLLGKQGRLSAEDEQWRRERNRWFDDAYLDPSTVDPTVYDHAVNPEAVAWFKAAPAAHLVAATLEHCAILDRYAVAWERVESDDPGRVVYEDEHQVVVVPRHELMVLGAGGVDRVDLWPAYDAVFGDQPDEVTWRAEVWDRHLAREGFRLAVLIAIDGRVLGFAYGYTGEHGQWWTDQVARTLAPDVAEEWLGGHFELVSIGVLDQARGRGHGATLLRAVTDGLPHERRLLMTTADSSDPARRLYAADGWRVLGQGVGDHTVVLGRRQVS